MGRWRDRYDYPYFPKSTPKEAKGGIKAQTKRGAFGQSWWAKRWIGVLESFNIGARLGRGRSYARRGQVLDIDVGLGTVSASVQGSRSKPYDVSIDVRTLTKEEWEAVGKELARQVVFCAKLLAGEVPEEIESVFQKAKCSLFPEKLKDLQTECSCPDWSNPCKHIAAVYYLLGEEFDRDPFLLFNLRGLEREGLIAILAGLHQETLEQGTEDTHEADAELESVSHLRLESSLFWGKADGLEDLLGPVETRKLKAVIPRELGAFPFWRGRETLIDALEPIYSSASERALEMLVGTMMQTETE